MWPFSQDRLIAEHLVKVNVDDWTFVYSIRFLWQFSYGIIEYKIGFRKAIVSICPRNLRAEAFYKKRTRKENTIGKRKERLGFPPKRFRSSIYFLSDDLTLGMKSKPRQTMPTTSPIRLGAAIVNMLTRAETSPIFQAQLVRLKYPNVAARAKTPAIPRMYGIYADRNPNIDETLSSADNDGLRFSFAAYRIDSIPAIAENAASTGSRIARDPMLLDFGYETCWVDVYPDDRLGLLLLLLLRFVVVVVVTVAPQWLH